GNRRKRVLVRDRSSGGICWSGPPGAQAPRCVRSSCTGTPNLTTRHNGDVTTATLTERPPAAAAPAVGRPNPTQIGTLVWLSSELMFFGGLFAMFFTLRSMAPDTFADGEANFTHGFALVNTSILVFSSVTCQIGV